MRLERLVIDAGGQLLTAAFHPRLTVVAGLEAREREALAGEILDAISGARPGVHLEVRTDAGRDLTVFRPVQGRQRVIDTDAVEDVTASFLGPDGTIDLFGRFGTSREVARPALRLSAGDLARGGTDAHVARLAAVDQDRLWAAAHALARSQDALVDAGSRTGTSPEDAALVAEVERRHAHHVAATLRYDRVRLLCFALGGVSAIAGLAVCTRVGVAGLPVVAVAVLATIGALLGRARVDRAVAAERDALHTPSARRYLAFQFERVTELLSDDEARREFMRAVAAHRRHQDAWREVAGEVPLTFALEREEAIRLTAHLQREVGNPTTSAMADEASSDLAHSLLVRLEGVRTLAVTGECLPLVVDDPFEGLDAADKPSLLELLLGAAGRPQIVLLTGADDIASWARLAATTGEVAVIEPTLTTAPS